MVVSRFHDDFPQVAGAQCFIDPQSILTLIRACRFAVFARLSFVHETEIRVVRHGLHELIGDTDGDIKVGQAAFVFGADKFQNIGMIAAQYAHLRTTPRTGRFNRRA